MANILGISRRAVAKQISILKIDGQLRRVGPDKGGHWEVIKNNPVAGYSFCIKCLHSLQKAN